MLIFPESSSSFISGLDSVLLSQLLALLSRSGRINIQREVLYVAMCVGDATFSLRRFLPWMKRKGLIGSYIA